MKLRREVGFLGHIVGEDPIAQLSGIFSFCKSQVEVGLICIIKGSLASKLLHGGPAALFAVT